MNRIWVIPNKIHLKNKKVTLLNLFYDLILVALVGGVVNRLVDMFGHNSFYTTEFVYVILELLTVMLVWKNTTLYSAQYEIENNLRNQFFIVIQMIGLILITASSFIEFKNNNDILEKVILINAIGLSIIFLILAYAWLTVLMRTKDKYQRKYLAWNFFGRLINIIIFAPIFVLHYKYHTVVGISTEVAWIIGLGIWGFNLLIFIWFDWMARSFKLSANLFEISGEYIQERYGIIFMIFIGEIIIEIITKSIDKLKTDTGHTIEIMILSFIMMFLWWWTFKDIFNFPNIRTNPRFFNLYTLAMILLLISTVIFATGITLIIANSALLIDKLVLSIGLFSWHLSCAISFTTLKDYHKEEKIYITKFIRNFIYFAPIISLIAIGLSFIDTISVDFYFLIILGISILYTTIPATMYIRQMRKKRKINDYSKIKLDKIIRIYQKKEESYVIKMKPFIDLEYHKKHNYKINIASKYIKNKKFLK